ncbi:MAG TPA: hypothetical protein EYP56_19490 [Planctomycetaceae bacterium]|nr:hypothetical protein [Planctomycetaceae bacterium]HIQ19838.1 hypothetical protein [Planctomycetota bacterium]
MLFGFWVDVQFPPGGPAAMGRIQSNIGLITGIPIGETVDKLMLLAARPRDLLVARTDALKEEQLAISELSGLLLSLKLTAEKLGQDTLYERRQATSSLPDVLSATVVGTPPIGTYQFMPLRTVRAQQLIAAGLKSDTEPLGGGELTFRFGDHVQRSVSLEFLGGGQGAVRGWIRITDRSGASAEIDLSTALTVDDVLEAINSNGQIGVTATTHGDRIRLVDQTGRTVSNLKVEEVGGGTTAASLGLAGIDVAASVADGQDMLYLAEALDLDVLNDGAGIGIDPVLADIRYQLRDGTSGQIDLSPILSGSSRVDRETTLGEVLERINAAAPGKLLVEIAPDGERLVVTDLTTGTGQFELEAINDSPALADLGLDGTADGGQLTGRRILGGLRTVLLSSLEGGSGLGPLGLLQLTDRSGASDTVDLTGLETLEEVIDAINAANVGIVAEVNPARNGIQLRDTTGGAGNLVVASGDGTNTAERLQVAVDAAVSSVSSGDLHLRVVSYTTRLDRLNGGAGVARGRIEIVDSQYGRAELDLRDDDIQTIGDVIRAINRLDVRVVAELNETGDGIRIRDLAGGPGKLTVSDLDSTAAADLHIAGEGQLADVGGQQVQVLDGSTTYRVQLEEGDTLRDLADKINQLDGGLSATILVDGSSRPYRLVLASQQPGQRGAIVVDASGLGLDLQEAVRGQDAILLVGDPSRPDSNLLVRSPTNTFTGVVPGLTLEAHGTASAPVTINVTTTDEDLVSALGTFVEDYNSFRQKLRQYTHYDTETGEASVLTGDAAALRLEADLFYLLSGRINGAGTIQSLAEVGIRLNDDGTLTFDASRLREKYQADPQAVREFFAREDFGMAERLGTLVEQLAEDEHSLLGQRIEALERKIQQNEDKVMRMNERLDAERRRLLLRFYRLETVIAKMQDSLNAIASLQAMIPPLIQRRSQ